MDVVHKISVDFGKEQIPQRISVMQNDSARKIEVSLYENGAVWNVPAGTSAYLAFRRPDGKNIKSISLEGGSPVVTFNENVATIQIPPELTFIDGDVPAVVVFVDANEKQIATFPTWVQVRENPSVESADDETIAPDQLTQILSAIASLKATVVQQSPLFANSIEECTDTTKLYVLPDGYIYAYTLGGGYTNLVPAAIDTDGSVYNGVGYQDGYALNGSDAGATIVNQAGFTVTGFIPVTWNDVVRMSGVTWGKTNKSAIAYFDENLKPLGSYIGSGYVQPALPEHTGLPVRSICMKDKTLNSVTTENGVATFSIVFNDKDTENVGSATVISRSGSHVKFMRISAEGNGSNMIVTVNEEIAGSSEAGYAWRNTGHAFVPADYEGRIIDLEEQVEHIRSDIENELSVKYVKDSLSGKTIVYDGDSICAGSKYTGGYAKIIAEKTGGFYRNSAIGGGILCSATAIGSDRHSVVDNLPNLPTGGDLYCFEGGINDCFMGANLGTYSKSDYSSSTLDTTTVCGALETIFRYALTNFVGKPICFVIIHKINSVAYKPNSAGDTFEDYRDAMIGICNKYAIPYYDAFAESGLNGWSQLHYDTYLAGDGVHPNEDGYKKYYVPQLCALFRKIMPDYNEETT